MDTKTKNALDKIAKIFESETSLAKDEFTTKMFADIEGINAEVAYKYLKRRSDLVSRNVKIDGRRNIAWRFK